MHLQLLHCRNLTIITDLLSIMTPESLHVLHFILFPIQIGSFQELSGGGRDEDEAREINKGKMSHDWEKCLKRGRLFWKEVEIFSDRCREKNKKTKKKERQWRLLWFNKSWCRFLQCTHLKHLKQPQSSCTASLDSGLHSRSRQTS